MARLLLISTFFTLAMTVSARASDRPNILSCFSDDWGRYASIYRDSARPGLNDVIDTPTLDAIGRSGVVLNNAFVSAPSCTPSRAAVVTGMPFYRCGSNAFLRCREYGKAPDPYPSRAIRTTDFLLIRNFQPDRMPMGDVYDSKATADPDHAKVLRELTDRLMNELRET